MHRPLETPFWLRLKQFLKGIFLYNTVYWKRASDDLDLQRMSREERASLRPQRDLSIIRPRGNPRPVQQPPPPALPTSPGGALMPATSSPEPVELATPSAATPTGEDGVEIRRRKKRRASRHSQVMPKKYYDGSGSGGGIIGWFFKR